MFRAEPSAPAESAVWHDFSNRTGAGLAIIPSASIYPESRQLQPAGRRDARIRFLSRAPPASAAERPFTEAVS